MRPRPACQHHCQGGGGDGHRPRLLARDAQLCQAAGGGGGGGWQHAVCGGGYDRRWGMRSEGLGLGAPAAGVGPEQ